MGEHGDIHRRLTGFLAQNLWLLALSLKPMKSTSRYVTTLLNSFERNRHQAQPGRLGENPRVDKSMKDSLDITLSIKSYGQFETFFDCLIEHVKAYIQTYYYSTGADGLGALWFSQHANIQWYPKGGGYPAVHCERDRIEYCQRALVWMLYLTDTPGGGYGVSSPRTGHPL